MTITAEDIRSAVSKLATQKLTEPNPFVVLVSMGIWKSYGKEILQDVVNTGMYGSEAIMVYGNRKLIVIRKGSENRVNEYLKGIK